MASTAACYKVCPWSVLEVLIPVATPATAVTIDSHRIRYLPIVPAPAVTLLASWGGPYFISGFVRVARPVRPVRAPARAPGPVRPVRAPARAPGPVMRHRCLYLLVSKSLEKGHL
jgi:branched-subunit amino acid ABC-type transport system permease component